MQRRSTGRHYAERVLRTHISKWDVSIKSHSPPPPLNSENSKEQEVVRVRGWMIPEEQGPLNQLSKAHNSQRLELEEQNLCKIKH